MSTAKKRPRPVEDDTKEAAAKKELGDLLYEHSVIADRMDSPGSRATLGTSHSHRGVPSVCETPSVSRRS
jgi:hypothetical protein